MSYATPLLVFASLALGACAPAPAASNGPGSDGAAPSDLAGGSDGGSDSDLATASGVTTIRVHYPAGAHALALRGDTAPLDWTHGAPLSSTDGKTFVYTFPNLAAPAEIKPLLDDATWSLGPNYRIPRGATVDLYPRFTTTSGKVVKLLATFHSALLGNDRAVWAYLPASYDENPLASYPVLYMHDGQNLFDPSLAFGGNEWKVDETLDAAAADGSIRELIVIGPENTSGRIYEYTPTTDPGTAGGGGGDLYLRMLVEELKPQIDAMLRTQPGRESTGIMGSSLGGLISAYAGVQRPDVFGRVGALSPSTWWNNDVLVADVKATATARPLVVYVDSGDSQSADDANDTALLAAAYVGLGYVEGQDFHHVIAPGALHNEVYWALRLPGALGFLFGPRTP